MADLAAGASAESSSNSTGAGMNEHQHACGTRILAGASSILPGISGQALRFTPENLMSLGDGVIGEGGFGSAHRATMRGVPDALDHLGRRQLSPIYVVKNGASEATPEMVAREAWCMTAVGEFGYISANNPKQLILRDGGSSLFDYMASGPLQRGINGQVSTFPLADGQRRILGKQLYDCLNRIHESSIGHFDLKPENIVVNGNGNITIIDYGSASQPCRRLGGMGIHKVATFTPAYAAPEVLERRPVTNKADVWSMGMILLSMTRGLGSMPKLHSSRNGFDLQAYHNLMQDIRADLTIPKDLKKVLTACLAYEPEKRPPAAQILQFKYFQPRKAEDMSTMELSVAHAQAFKELAEVEQAMDMASADPGLNQASATMIYNRLTECRTRVKALQAELDKHGSSADSVPVLRRRHQPRWSR